MWHVTKRAVLRWAEFLLHIHDTPERTAAAFGVGVLIGFTPFVGFHNVIGIAIAFMFNLNRVAVLAGCWVNLPWVAVPYYAGGTYVGAWITGTPMPSDFLDRLSLAWHSPTWSTRSARSSCRIPSDRCCSVRFRGSSPTNCRSPSSGRGAATARYHPRRTFIMPLKASRLSRAFRRNRRRLVAGVLAAAAVLLLYNATVIDSKNSAREATAPKLPPPAAGARMDFIATAYCKGDTTSAGVTVQAGIAAADPSLLPEGSVVQIDGVENKYRGIYTVMDTGPMVGGHHIDLYIWSCTEALEFGRRPVTVTILRRGWNPKNTSTAIR